MDSLPYATDYARRGMTVIPAHYPVRNGGVVVCSCGKDHGTGKQGKHPAIGWRQYQNEAPTVSVVHHHFCFRFRGFNIACVHGAVSGTVLLDWDGPEGQASRRALERELGTLPDTPTVLSGGGGMHELYQHPGTHVPTNKGLREGFDVRGDGGISILPPSVHEFGVYQWECDKALNDMPLAELSQPWVAFITESVSTNQFSKQENVQWEQADDGSMIVYEGREEYMRRIVWDTFSQLRNPTVQELYDAALPTIMSHIDRERPGHRDPEEVWMKCEYLIRKQKHVEPRGLQKQFLKR